MLRKLDINNYAIIEQLEVDFSKNLTIITGETGAGKSILLGALSLILGKRVSSDQVFLDPGKKCIIEGEFDVGKKKLKQFFKDNDLDFEEITIIRREVSPSGKSRAFVNDTPVNLQVLSALGDRLINLHAQHQTLYLNDPVYQLSIIDNIAGHMPFLEGYKALYAHYKKQKQELNKMITEANAAKKEVDFIQFQLNELEQAALKDSDEQEKIEAELKQLENAEFIKAALFDGTRTLSDESAVLTGLQKITRNMEKLSPFGEVFEQLQLRMKSFLIELNDFSSELEGAGDSLDVDPERTKTLQDRLDTILKLQNKHSADSIEALINIQESLQQKLFTVTNSEELIEQLQKDCDKSEKELIKRADVLFKNRKKAIPKLEKTVNALLCEMGMPHAFVKMDHQINEEEKLTENGKDSIRLLFASNKGSTPVEVRKVASGGELSRLMLSIQHLVANRMDLPTMIFDEIDTGISGEIAIKMGKVLKRLSKKHQLVCITHLPQIACIGETHYRVYKEEKPDRTVSQIEKLNEKDRIVEIGTILSGEPPGKQAKANARELLNLMNA